MTSDARKKHKELFLSWKCLAQLCSDNMLTRPELCLSPLGYRVFIGNTIAGSGQTEEEALVTAQHYVYGWMERCSVEEKAAEPEGDLPQTTEGLLAYAASKAKAVLDGVGLGGPADHTHLARAILALTCIDLEKLK